MTLLLLLTLTTKDPTLDRIQPPEPLRFVYLCECTGVYDGDTITASIDLGLNVTLHKQKLRLYGIDTPELRGEDRIAGLKARDHLRALILSREGLLVQTLKDKTGKYGRWLAIIWRRSDPDDPDSPLVNVNLEMIRSGHAKERYY